MKCVAFLDILGFTNHIRESSEAAARMLSAANVILNTRIREDMMQQEQQKETCFRKNPIKQMLVDKLGYDSFECYLPSSDSILLTSNDANLFILQLSTFLCECLNYNSDSIAYPINPANPSESRAHFFEQSKDGAFCEVRAIKSYPNLFRGGISCGDSVFYIPCQSIVFNELTTRDENERIRQDALCPKRGIIQTVNITGETVLKAIELEKATFKGAKLFIDEAFFNLLDNANRALVVKETDGTMYYLWQAHDYIISNGVDPCFFDFKRNFAVAFNMWKAWKDEVSYGSHYTEHLKMVVESFRRIASVTYPDEAEKIRLLILSTMQESQLDEFFFNID